MGRKRNGETWNKHGKVTRNEGWRKGEEEGSKKAGGGKN